MNEKSIFANTYQAAIVNKLLKTKYKLILPEEINLPS
jgi:hypothetical protein